MAQYLKNSSINIPDSEVQNIIHNHLDGVVILDDEGIVRFLNPSAQHLLGRTAEEILGEPLEFQIKAGEPSEIVLTGINGEPETIEARLTKMDRENSKADLILLRDITDRKKMEEELRRTYHQLLDQQKKLIEEERMQVIFQMAGATVHELSQPLTVLLGNLDMLELSARHSEEYNLCVGEIKRAGENIAEIIKKIQSIRHYESKPYFEDISIVNIDQETNILVIENSDTDFIKLSCIIETYEKMRLFRAKTFKGARKMLADRTYDLIILEQTLPDGTGLEFLKLLDEEGISIPTAVISRQKNEVMASQLIKAGAYDYLPKANISEKSVGRVISNALEKFKLKNEMKQTVKRMKELATRDELTNLYNQKYFKEAMEREIAAAKRYKKDLSLCMIDLDHLSQINTSFGRGAGDMILKEFAVLLTENMRKSDLLCRYDSDEFAVILPYTDMKKAQMFSERIRDRVEKHMFEYVAVPLNITISVGISSYSEKVDQKPLSLLQEADRALNEAKKKGGNKVTVYF